MSRPRASRSRTSSLALLTGLLTAAATLTLPATVAQGAAKTNPGYTTYFSGSTTNAITTPLGGALLAGGGTDSDAGMQWLLARGGARPGGGYGDVVVLRTSGTNGYNKYLIRLGANSVTSIVISSVTGANSTVVRDAIARAEVVFIAGGDQATYVNLWRGTGLQTAVNARVAAGYPIGGTSAGLAVLGRYVFAALNDTTTSATALANPYDPTVTLTSALFTVPNLGNVITDSHFVTRDRMGRLLTFLARLQQDGTAAAPRAIAVDETSAVGITAGGAATVFGAGSGAYFLNAPSNTVRTCVNTSPATPLSITPIATVHVPVGKGFNVSTWTTSDAMPYTLSVVAGVVHSTASIY